MRMVDLINKKKQKQELTKEEIHYLINGYVKGEIPDYQVSALLMAICYEGLNDNELYYLTKEMLESGDEVDLSEINGLCVDKHSTGGVGDKTSLVIAPICASFGLKLAKMSGRGLGHTGGTLDKLESIPGLTISLSLEDFVEIESNSSPTSKDSLFTLTEPPETSSISFASISKDFLSVPS